MVRLRLSILITIIIIIIIIIIICTLFIFICIYVLTFFEDKSIYFINKLNGLIDRLSGGGNCQNCVCLPCEKTTLKGQRKAPNWCQFVPNREDHFSEGV